MAEPVPEQAPYPVDFDVEPCTTGRNRLTVAFRIILAIPQVILVGGPGLMFGGFFGWPWGDIDGRWFLAGGSAGLLGIAAELAAVISWFAIVFTGKQPQGLWDLTNFYIRWRAPVVAYTGLLRDEYPPFGTGDPYPVRYTAGDFPEKRDRLSVALRLIYAVPHVIVLFFLGIAWLVTAIIGWFSVLLTGSYPEGLYRFGVGYLRWTLRVQAYLLLMRDEYPPFRLES